MVPGRDGHGLPPRQYSREEEADDAGRRATKRLSRPPPWLRTEADEDEEEEEAVADGAQRSNVLASSFHWESDDGEEALRDQYTRPRFRRQPPVVWVPRDEAGLAERECRRMRSLGIPATCVDAELRPRRPGQRRPPSIVIRRVDVPAAPPTTPRMTAGQRRSSFSFVP
ncbi:hypothetical protein SYNPS1DRAFT_23507 [Syncephalis pseudoplumigaleata]|uniref:10TM putative phosphate transporter extracellular tail domain-containing protein n=1 Tax=Syncephalis pseudoplumigaleata TaxID=1712513 RepID=A0A4P9YXZ1_9FUNG|nr:hypothetical protein SYNPS1DRAFT_23507 [Syncephalis pseudoplumigaleata]|eukprot:RKP24402.1 hypothetical protein SYNPS1DRAFT_23507 [Syncephalis pseudoplumigaleata]